MSSLEGFLIALLALLVAGLLFGLGTCAHKSEVRKDAAYAEKQRQEATIRLECLRSGKSLIGDSCVKVAP